MTNGVIAIRNEYYSVMFDPARSLVQVELHGVWDVATAQRYEREFRAGLAQFFQAGCALRQQITLIDLTRFAVQPQEVAVLLERFAADQSIAPRRTAMVLDKMLLKLQARRVAPDYQVFDDRAEALAWLLQPSG